jgi:hypothetical protein
MPFSDAQLSVIRGDTFSPERVTLISDGADDFTGLTCTGMLRAFPDGDIVHTFYPTVISGAYQTGQVTFEFSPSVTQNFPCVNLFGDIEFFATGVGRKTYLQFRLDVLPNVTHT